MSVMIVRATSSWDSIQWGNVPAWAAFVAAVVGATLAAGAYRRESRRDRINEAIRLQEQASKISAWRDKVVLDMKPPGSRLNVPQFVRPGVHVRNASDLPVDAVVVYVPYNGPDGTDFVKVLDVVAPGATELVVFPDGWDVGRAGPVRLSFRDARGVSWVRASGQLIANVEKEQPAWYKAFEFTPNLLTEAFGALRDAIAAALTEVTSWIGQLVSVFIRRR